MGKSSTFAAAAVLALSLPTLAGAGSPTDPTRDQQTQSAGVVKLRGTVIAYGTSGTLAAGFNNIDSGSTLSCGSAPTCTIEAADMMQILAGTNGALWAICVLVDGNYANPGCPYQGAATNANYQIGNSQQSYVVGSGNHTVQTQVYVDTASTLGSWQVTYRIYKGE